MATPTVAQEPHTHRYRVETPNGERSWGECACGARKQFWNSLAVDRGGAAAAISSVTCPLCGDLFVNKVTLRQHIGFRHTEAAATLRDGRVEPVLTTHLLTELEDGTGRWQASVMCPHCGSMRGWIGSLTGAQSLIAGHQEHVAACRGPRQQVEALIRELPSERWGLV